MPRISTYPLKPLREHHERTVDAATSQLGGAVRAREAADDAKRQAEQERLEADARAAVVRQVEAERLVKGELCVADLARAQTWEYAASVESSELDRTIHSAEGRLAEARHAEGRARAELAQKKADLDVVVKDEARFDDGARRVREAGEEEAADEAFAARRRDG